ncbi:MAG TPA: hypothetical protein VM901_08905 [Bdellovibrionota bacterium]|jgi:hypothetical protein|nr:hypothetical protein [Bdellovibrionota bacterium]
MAKPEINLTETAFEMAEANVTTFRTFVLPGNSGQIGRQGGIWSQYFTDPDLRSAFFAEAAAQGLSAQILSLVARSMEHYSPTSKDNRAEAFQTWDFFFKCCEAFLTDPALKHREQFIDSLYRKPLASLLDDESPNAARKRMPRMRRLSKVSPYRDPLDTLHLKASDMLDFSKDHDKQRFEAAMVGVAQNKSLEAYFASPRAREIFLTYLNQASFEADHQTPANEYTRLLLSPEATELRHSESMRHALYYAIMLDTEIALDLLAHEAFAQWRANPLINEVVFKLQSRVNDQSPAVREIVQGTEARMSACQGILHLIKTRSP